MEEKETRGGKRLGAGRKPSANKKIPVTLYVEKKAIWPFGNEPKMKEKLMEFINNYSIPIIATPKEVYNSPPLKITYDEPPKYLAPKTAFKSAAQYLELKRECETAEQWQTLWEEINSSQLTYKEKQILKTA